MGDPANWLQFAVQMDFYLGSMAAWVENLSLWQESQATADLPLTKRGASVSAQIPRRNGATGMADWMQFELFGQAACTQTQHTAPFTYSNVVCDDTSRVFLDCQVVKGP